jgi:ribonuclease P protein component
LTRPRAGFSFSRVKRLGGPDAFTAVFAYKCSVAGNFFQVYAKPNFRAGCRLGITVNKRLVPNATARNFCKRLARETFRIHAVALGGIDLVVRARAPVRPASAPQARAEIIELMQRAWRLCRHRAESTQHA